MTRLTQEMRDEITSAMLGIVERFDVDPIDMPPLAHAAAAECCRVVEALDRGRAVIATAPCSSRFSSLRDALAARQSRSCKDRAGSLWIATALRASQ